MPVYSCCIGDMQRYREKRPSYDRQSRCLCCRNSSRRARRQIDALERNRPKSTEGNAFCIGGRRRVNIKETVMNDPLRYYGIVLLPAPK